MTEDQVFEVVREAVHARFGAPKGTITRGTIASDVPGWDSVNYAALLMELENLLGCELPVEQLFGVENLGELCDEINRTVP
jgi:acyl carrier protein